MNSDPLAFLRATLDAAQARAEAAGGDEWAARDYAADTIAVYNSQREAIVYDEGWPSPEQVAHIVANSPAAVLRRIAADRETLADYELTVQIRDEAAQRIKDAGDRPDSTDLDTWDRAQREAGILVGVVHNIAAGWGWTGETT